MEQYSTHALRIGPASGNDTTLASTLHSTGVAATWEKASVRYSSTGSWITAASCAFHAEMKGPSNTVMTGVQCSLSTTDKSVGCSCKAESRSAQTDPQAIDRACSTEDSRDSTVTVLPAASVIEQSSTHVVQVGPVTSNDTNLFSTLCCIGVVTTCQEASVQSTSSGTCGTESASHANQKGPSNAVTTGVQCSLYMADKSVGCSYKAESRSAQTDPQAVDRACSTEGGLHDALSQQQEPSLSSNNDEEGRHNNGKFGSTKRNVSRCLSIMSDPKYCGPSFGDDCDPTEVLKSDTLYSLEKNKEDEDHQQRDGAQEAVVSTSLPPQSLDPVMTMPPPQSGAHLQALRTEIAYQHREGPLSPQKDVSTIRHRQSTVSQVPLKDMPPLWPPPFTTRPQAQQLSQKKMQRPLDEKEFEQQPEVLWHPGELAEESMVENTVAAMAPPSSTAATEQSSNCEQTDEKEKKKDAKMKARKRKEMKSPKSKRQKKEQNESEKLNQQQDLKENRIDFFSIMNGCSKTFKKSVRRAYTAAHSLNIEKLGSMKLGVKIYHPNSTNYLVNVAIARLVPKAMAPTVALECVQPSLEVVLSHYAMVCSLYSVKDLLENLTPTDCEAATFVYLLMRKQHLQRSDVFHHLNSYFASLFGTNVQWLKKKQKRRDEEIITNQEAAWSCIFDYYASSPVTVHERTGKRLSSVRVAHEAVLNSNKRYYVYLMKSRIDCAYAVLCTILNPMFISQKWLQPLLEMVPQRYHESVIKIYGMACRKSSSTKCYLATVYSWLLPALSASYDRFVQDCQGRREEETVEGDEILNREVNAVLAITPQLERARLFAYHVVAGTVLPQTDPLHEMGTAITKNAILKKYRHIIENLRRRIPSWPEEKKQMYVQIAREDLQCNINNVLGTHSSWQLLPSLTSPEYRIYEEPSKTEHFYALTFQKEFADQVHVSPNAELSHKYFTPSLCRAKKLNEAQLDMIQKSTAQLFFSILQYYMTVGLVNNKNQEEAKEADRECDRQMSHRVTKDKKSSAILPKQKGDNTRKCIVVFWCEDLALMERWATCISMVVRLHLDNPALGKHKLSHSRRIQTFFMQTGERVTRSCSTCYSSLEIFFCVCKEQPNLILKKNRWSKSVFIIYLNKLKEDCCSSADNDRTTTYICPRAVVNAIRSKCNNFPLDFILRAYGNATKNIAENSINISSFFNSYLSNKQ